DSAGFLWFSGWTNEIFRIDPATDLIEPMTGATATGTPDGLWVDSRDIVWFGAYNGRYLGALTAGSAVTRYLTPEMPSNPPSHPPIRCEDADGRIWVTDHIANRVSSLDASSGTWLSQVIMPMPSAWVVECVNDAARRVLWLTLYNVRRLGRLEIDTGVVDTFE